ncbi:MAG: DMT family transporter [Vallitaleaceae bacterium]|nr:DMT family transporter [Vallitaleaceae bacterium]
MTNYLGEIIAIGTAICWAITSTAFASAGKKIGSLSLNIIRLWFAFIFLFIFTWITRGIPYPIDAGWDTWKWLLLSGLIGFVMGDLFLFEAFVRIGARISMLIFASVPPMSALLAYFILGDTMTMIQIIGMIVTIFGISIVILTKGNKINKKKIKLAHPVVGVLLAFGGAFGQSLGYIVGKMGLGDYNAFAATQIRVSAAIVGFVIVVTVRGGWPSIGRAFKQKKAMISTIIGSVFGPFIGVSLSLLALKYTSPGVASTLMAITPILLIPVAIFYYKEKMPFKEILGAFVAIVGVAIMFI